MTHDYRNMISYTLHVIPVGIGKGTIITAGYGDAKITTYTAARGTRRCTFTKVLHMPEISINLLSTESLREKGVFYRSDRQQLFIAYTSSVDVVLADVYSYNGLPHLVTELPATALMSSKVTRKAEATMLVWHLRLGYIHPRKLLTIAKQGLIEITSSRQLHCVACLLA